ncbi:MAG: ComEC family competence protein [Candidatus Latescibacteria bacterium ADurb.Bin168]|nr:MAG: ComEC family competence protein [Candidatus Latescibacteria bacterium ADurb.Bin168]
MCRFSTGHTIVIDGGPATAGWDAGDWVVVPYLRSRGIRRVDAIVVTHSDSDHLGGLPAVARAVDTRAVWYNGSGDTASAFRVLALNIRQRGGRLQVAGAGDSVAGLGTARLTFLSPMRDSAWSARCSDNDRSLVLRIVEHGDTLLFTGDTGQETERMYSRLLRTESGARVDVLKVAHHGSRFSTGDTLLAAARPRYAVISVGRNSYGHPARETLERLRVSGATVLRTDRQGTLIWRTEPAGGGWVEWR